VAGGKVGLAKSRGAEKRKERERTRESEKKVGKVTGNITKQRRTSEGEVLQTASTMSKRDLRRVELLEAGGVVESAAPGDMRGAWAPPRLWSVKGMLPSKVGDL
jgi:hypothetical protein